MSDEGGLIFAVALNGQGGCIELEWESMTEKDGRVHWIHLHRLKEPARAWLRETSELDSIVTEALLVEDTRPRSVIMGRGLMLILRGVNLNEGADPEDMVSIRLWLEEQRIISLRYPKVMAIQDVRESLDAGRGPHNVGDFIADLVARLVDRAVPVVEELAEQIDVLEADIANGHQKDLRITSVELRRRAIILRRYFSPQRDVLSRIQGERLPFLEDVHRAQLRESADRLLRLVEDLDTLRERAAIAREELMARHSEEMNRNMYILAMVSAIFLPLGLITGLLGINVAGIPGESFQWAFTVVCGMLVILAGVGIWILRRLSLF